MFKRLGLAAVAAVALVGSAYALAPTGPPRSVPIAAAATKYYDAYYDGHYGRFVDGYWGTDGAFWYADGDQIWRRDEAHHFAHQPGDGLAHIYGSGTHREH